MLDAQATAPIEKIYKYRLVSAVLATSGQPTVAQLANISEAGYRVIINLALHDDPRYSLPDEPGAVAALGMTYIHIPVQFETPLKADFDAFCEAMDGTKELKTWVHCAANIRVSAFLGLYRVLREGADPATSFDLMNSLWKPDAVWTKFIAAQLAASTAST